MKIILSKEIAQLILIEIQHSSPMFYMRTQKFLQDETINRRKKATTKINARRKTPTKIEIDVPLK